MRQSGDRTGWDVMRWDRFVIKSDEIRCKNTLFGFIRQL